MKLQCFAPAHSPSGSSSKGKLLSTGQRLKEAVSSQAYQVRLVSIFLLLPRLSRLLFLLGLTIINLQPPFAQEQKESVRSGLSRQSIISPCVLLCPPLSRASPPSPCCAPTQPEHLLHRSAVLPPSRASTPSPSPSLHVHSQNFLSRTRIPRLLTHFMVHPWGWYRGKRLRPQKKFFQPNLNLINLN